MATPAIAATIDRLVIEVFVRARRMPSAVSPFPGHFAPRPGERPVPTAEPGPTRSGRDAEPTHLLEQPAVREPELFRRTRLALARARERGPDARALELVDVAHQPARRADGRDAEEEAVGEELRGDPCAGLGEEDRTLELVLELADVPRKRVRLERAQRLGRRAGDRLPGLPRQARDQVLDEGRDVVAALAQCGQPDRKD